VVAAQSLRNDPDENTVHGRGRGETAIGEVAGCSI
jgi:hypothetical protein